MRRGTWIIGRLHYMFLVLPSIVCTLRIFFMTCNQIVFYINNFHDAWRLCVCVFVLLQSSTTIFKEIYYLWWKPKCFFILRYIYITLSVSEFIVCYRVLSKNKTMKDCSRLESRCDKTIKLLSLKKKFYVTFTVVSY